jgi:hypothetical protein
MAYFNDGLPPPVLNCVEGLPWVPTMELTLHFLQRPNKDLCKDRWLLLNYKCDVLVGGRLVSETTLWDTVSRLLYVQSSKNSPPKYISCTSSVTDVYRIFTDWYPAGTFSAFVIQTTRRATCSPSRGRWPC